MKYEIQSKYEQKAQTLVWKDKDFHEELSTFLYYITYANE